MKKIVKTTNGTMAMKLDTLAKQKTNVYNLAAGDPIMPLDNHLRFGLSNSGHNYGSAYGNIELRKLLNKNPNEVVIANGVKQLIYMSLMATCDSGDEVIIIGPCWSSYFEICKLLKLNYKVCLGDNIEDCISERTSAVLFNNPNNPTGRVYEEKFINKLHSYCCENDVWLISDEIYDEILYDNVKFYSLRGKKNVIYLNGFSKNYGLTGWRLGYCICEEELAKQIMLIQSQLSGPPNTVMQDAVLYTLKNYGKIKKIDVKELQERRDFICSCGEKFEKFKPYGGFYFYIPVENSEEVCKEYLEKYNIIMTPGDDYGVKNTIRISFASITLNRLKEIEEELKKLC